MKKTLLRWIGGSHLYGLNTKDSDIDYRSVVLKNDVLFNLGITGKPTSRHKQSEEEDEVERDFLHYLKLLMKGNPEVVETLFIPSAKLLVSDVLLIPFFQQPSAFFNSRGYYNALIGYSYGEETVAFGEAKQGSVGDKRRKLVKKYGFSPKNLTQAFRLVRSGIEYFDTGRITFNYPWLYELKNKPGEIIQEFSIEELKIFLENDRLKLKKSFDGSIYRHEPNLPFVARQVKMILAEYGGF